MTETDSTQVDQITREPEQKIERVKNPKKVAAGKRLVEYHKKAKQALKQEKEHENNEVIEEDNANSKWLPEISLTTGLTIIGIGLTVFDLYLRYQKKDNIEAKPQHIKDVPKTSEPSPSVVSKQDISKIPVPKRIGME